MTSSTDTARSETRASSARARVRAELTEEITDVARTHLARDGAAALSLRAVARDLGMSSSAVYRYFPSRDALLTALIIEAYDSLGEVVERGDAAAAADSESTFAARAAEVFRNVRRWARSHPHEWALIYGSPVPGYAAPQDTIGPASRVSILLVRLLAEAAAVGELSPGPAPRVPGRSVLSEMLENHGSGALSDDEAALMATGVAVRDAVYGVISFELNGQHQQVVADAEAFFEGALTAFLSLLGRPTDA